MKRKVILLSVFLVLCGGVNSFAQDVNFAQYFSNPLLINPAYTGSIGCSRVALNYRNFLPAIHDDYRAYSASYDQYVKPIYGGVGLQVISDHLGYETSTSVSGSYAYNLNLKNNLHIRPAINLGMGLKQIDWSGFSTTPTNKTSSKYYFNVGTGLLIAYKNFITGFSYDHINRPDIGFYETFRLPSKLAIHCSYQFDINERAFLTPGIIFFKQQNYNEIAYNLLLKYHFIKAGIGFRQGFDNPDGATFMLGYCNDYMSIGYSYDIYISKLSTATGGTQEISATFKFNCKNDKEKFKITQLNGF